MSTTGMSHAVAQMSETALGDAESLRAALAMVEDWDTEFSALFSLETLPPVGFDAVTKGNKVATRQRGKDTTSKSAPYASKPRKDPRKLEILELRAQVEELQRIVDAAKPQKPIVSSGSSSTGTTDEAAANAEKPLSPSADEVAMEREWERLSIRQESQRLAAQLENSKLKKLMETQVKDAQKIIQLTQRLTLLQQNMPPMIQEMGSLDGYQGPTVNAFVQHAGLDILLQQADSIFSSGAFVELADRQSFREIHFRDCDHDVDGVVIESELSWMLPYETEQVADALWEQASQLKSKEKIFDQQDLLKDASSLVTQFIGRGVTDTSHGQIATLRCAPNPENGSILLISNAQVRMFIQDRVKGCVNGDGWLLVEPVRSQQQSNRKTPLTRVKWCRRAQVKPLNYELMTPEERKQWVHMAISGHMRRKVESSLDWNVQAVENILLTPKPIKTSQ